MLSHFHPRLIDWFILLLLAAAAVAVVVFAPGEATIGQGIKIVYIHVALIWTGMLGLLISGVIGAVVALTNHDGLRRWLPIISWVSLGFYAAGVLTSLYAEQVNWGGIAWQEPRTKANLNLLALATVVQVVASFINRPRWHGLLSVLLAAAVIWTTAVTPLQLHPDDPIGTSTSNTIQVVFYLLFMLCCLSASWFIWQLRPRSGPNQSPA